MEKSSTERETITESQSPETAKTGRLPVLPIFVPWAIRFLADFIDFGLRAVSLGCHKAPRLKISAEQPLKSTFRRQKPSWPAKVEKNSEKS
jgi:hypothetical protein